MIKEIVKYLIERAYPQNKFFNDTEFECYWKWLHSGKPSPPPDIVKKMTIKEHANRYAIRIMVETGTYKGDMVFAVKDVFEKIYSIELDNNIYANVKERFKKYEHVKIYNGDSSEVILKIIKNISEPCLFWLDGHYMPSIGTKGEKETPIMKEVEHISNHFVKNHVLLIDDARFFIGEHDYPTIKEFHDAINIIFPEHSFEVESDIIRVTPKCPY